MRRFVLLFCIVSLLLPLSVAAAAYSRTFHLTADVSLELPEPVVTPTPVPDDKTVRIVYHAGYYSNEQIEDSAPRRSSFTLPGALFERDGYQQIGWSTWPYSSFVQYEFGDTCRTNTNTLHFYAVWQYDWDWDSLSPFDSLYGTDSASESFVSDTPEAADETPSPDLSTPESNTPEPDTPQPDTPAPDTPAPDADTPDPTVSPSGGGE